jgi:hypothetical protein
MFSFMVLLVKFISCSGMWQFYAFIYCIRCILLVVGNHKTEHQHGYSSVLPQKVPVAAAVAL